MILNLAAVAIFAINWFIRTRVAADSPWPLILSIVGIIGVGISGRLGGELVYVHRVAVGDEAIAAPRPDSAASHSTSTKASPIREGHGRGHATLETWRRRRHLCRAPSRRGFHARGISVGSMRSRRG